MGAAASTQAEHDELRAVFERFKTSPGNGDDLDAAAFAELVREAAPTVHPCVEHGIEELCSWSERR